MKRAVASLLILMLMIMAQGCDVFSDKQESMLMATPIYITPYPEDSQSISSNYTQTPLPTPRDTAPAPENPTTTPEEATIIPTESITLPPQPSPTKTSRRRSKRPQAAQTPAVSEDADITISIQTEFPTPADSMPEDVEAIAPSPSMVLFSEEVEIVLRSCLIQLPWIKTYRQH